MHSHLSALSLLIVNFPKYKYEYMLQYYMICDSLCQFFDVGVYTRDRVNVNRCVQCREPFASLFTQQSVNRINVNNMNELLIYSVIPNMYLYAIV